MWPARKVEVLDDDRVNKCDFCVFFFFVIAFAAASDVVSFIVY